MAGGGDGMARAPRATVPNETGAGPQHERAGGTEIGVGLIARGFIVVLLLWALANVIWLARDILFVAFFAVLVASFLSIFVDFLQQRGVRRAVAAPLVLFTFVAVLAVVLMLSWPTLESQFGTVSRQLPEAIGKAESWLSEQFRTIFGTLGQAGGAVEERVRTRAAEELADLVGGTLPLLNTAVGTVSGLLLVMFSGMFLAIEPRTYSLGLLRLVPASRRLDALRVLEDIGTTMRRWMAAQAAGMLIIGIATTIGYVIIGVPAALALGLIAGLLEFVPYVGPVLAFIPAVALSLTVSLEMALWVVALYGVIQFLESNIVMPLLIKGVVKLPPALTLLFQAMMATLFGFLGLLLAVPILAAGKVVVQELYVDEVAEES